MPKSLLLMGDYSNLDQSYPNPSNQYVPHPREQYNYHPSQRAPQHRVLDESPYTLKNSDHERDQHPSFHTMPNPDNSHFSQPYSHAMKRVGNAEKMREIFGEKNQDFSGMDNIDFNKPIKSVERFSQPIPQQSQEYIPRMKIIDNESVNHSQSNHSQSQLAQSKINSSRIQVYNAIIEYFPGFIMCKTSIHGNLSVYKGYIQCLLCDGSRYIVAIVSGDTSPIGTKKPLNTLSWEAFQTRYVENDSDQKTYGISSHQYARPDKTILNDVIRLGRKTQRAFIYSCDNLPLQIEILKLKDDEDINETGTVASSLELFQTILSFTD